MSPARLRVRAAVVGAVATVAGLLAASAAQHPTGDPRVDAMIRGVGVALIVLIASRAPWWAVATAAGTALAIALNPLLMGFALVALGLAVWVGSTSRDRPELVALSVGITFNVLARAQLHDPFALSAFITGLVAVLLLVTGLHHQPRLVRRVGWAALGVLVLAAGAATMGFGAAAFKARHDLAGGRNTAELGVAALENGDYDSAEQWFREAAGFLARAHTRLTEPWARAAGFVPIIAQHRDAVVDISGTGADGASIVADALADVDLGSLRTVDGRIDVDALAGLQDPLTRVRDALVEMKSVTDEVRSPWLVHRADIELDDFDESVGEHLPSIDSALTALRLSPDLLGAKEPRRYLVLFTTPSESRGLGGFVGNYAELSVDDGRLAITDFGRAQKFDRAAEAAGARVHGHEEFLHRYGQFGFDTDGSGAVGGAAFRNVTMSPNFPWVGEIAADLYTQTTGRHVDGTLMMDPYVIQTLVRYAGPIQLSTIDEELTGDSTADFLLRGQYDLSQTNNDLRVDALAEAARLTFQALLGTTLPEPTTLARDLAPLVNQRRLLMWSADPEEQALLERVHMAGRIPPLDGRDGWSVTVSNAAGSKIDSYLRRRASYTASTDGTSGETTATLRFELTNTAPADGLPPYVIGNQIGAPKGTSRLYVSFYSALALDGVTLDGAATGLSVGSEEGWNVYSGFVDIPAGGTATFELHLKGAVADPDHVVTWEQPMGSPLEPLD